MSFYQRQRETEFVPPEVFRHRRVLKSKAIVSKSELKVAAAELREWRSSGLPWHLIGRACSFCGRECLLYRDSGRCEGCSPHAPSTRSELIQSCRWHFFLGGGTPRGSIARMRQTKTSDFIDVLCDERRIPILAGRYINTAASVEGGTPPM